MTAAEAFVEEMRAVGVALTDPWDLVNTRSSYMPAVPVLVSWLRRADAELTSGREKFREGLVRALTVGEARGAANQALLEEFRRPDASEGYRWSVGNALEVVATQDDLDDLLAIAADRTYGRARQMVVLGLGRFKDDRVTAALIQLLDDAGVRGHAVIALGRLKDPRARDALKAHASDEKRWVRSEVAKALAKLDA